MIRRVYHHWEKWEAVEAGMYDMSPPEGMSTDEAVEAYTDFLADVPRFESAMQRVIVEWPISCEQFLSNVSINRIAWLGQASMCIDTGVPCVFRRGFSRLSGGQQKAANNAAALVLSNWEFKHSEWWQHCLL